MWWPRSKRHSAVVHAADLHMHSTFSPDGRSSMRSMCAHAVKLGLRQIAFTEHAEWNGSILPFRPNVGYFSALADCRKRFAPKGLHILSGVELGNPHWFSAESSALLSAHQFDIRIGSIHWLYDNHNIHGPAIFANREPVAVFADYFEQAERMVRKVELDVLAHCDRIWWRARAMGIRCSAGELAEQIQRVLVACVERGVMLELNSKHIDAPDYWRDDMQDILGWYKEAGGSQVVLSSDAHHTSQIGRNFETALGMLNSADLQPYTPSRAA